MRNADFRFCTQIRSHFLLHQEANHHRYFEGYPYFSPTSIGTLMVTHLGISQLFCRPSVGAQIMTHLGISHFLLSFNRHTNSDTPLDIPTFSPPAPRDIFIASYRFSKRIRKTFVVTSHSALNQKTIAYLK